MPLPSDGVSSSVTDDWLTQHRQALLDFANDIEACISNSDWEALADVLDVRQNYLEQMFSNPVPEHFRAAAKLLAESVLQQDVIFQARIEELKNIAMQQQLSFERGQRAAQAYNNQ